MFRRTIHDRPAGAICVLFLLSGFTALVYQIIWVRLLTLAFGASGFAVAAVLIAFMGGMSIGSFASARVIDRRSDQLVIYAVLEFAIGAYALAIPFIIGGLSHVYIWTYQQFTPGFYQISLIRLVVSVLILLVPTAAMGATLPVLCSRFAADADRGPRRTALLYGINTLGGVLGCLAAGFILLPAIGLTGTTYLCVLGNVLIGAAGLLVHRRLRPIDGQGCPEPEVRAQEDRPKRQRPPADAEPTAGYVVGATVAVTSLSGFTAMAYETLWTRVLTMVVGTTVYAFTTMLATFLCGLVLGNLLYWMRPARRPLIVLALCQAGIGMWALLAMPHFDQLPFAFLKVFQWARQSWLLFQCGRFAMLFLILLVPATLFGISFPLAVQVVLRKAGETGRRVGFLYGFNTIGNILGAFVGGFVLIPFVGLQQGMLITAVLNIVGAVALVVVEPRRQPARRWMLGGAVTASAVLAAFALTPWNIRYLNSGAYVYGQGYNNISDLKSLLNEYHPVFYEESTTGTVAVILSPNGTLSLTIDGKTDASTGQNADMSTQVLLSHLPALFASRLDDGLLVGLGSGVSLGSLLQHPIGRVDVLEISEAVVHASDLFRDHNHNALDDPRVNLIVADGRHHLERTARRYDLIVSQPSNPWITGVSNLFTREYYRLMSRRLSERGVVCQWVPSYHMSREMLGVVCKTFVEVFPDASLWTSSVVGDLFLIGSNGPMALEWPVVRDRFSRAPVRDDLARIGMDDPAMLARAFKYSPEGLRGFLAGLGADLAVNTDMRPVLEFQSPRYLLTMRVARDFRRPDDLRGDLDGLAGMIRFEEEANRSDFLRRAGALLGSADATAIP